MSRGYVEGKIYVGGLPADATSDEIDDAFRKYGRIRKIWIARRPPGFAFVEYDDSRDAEDAVKAMDGARVCGVRARVQMSHGGGRGGGGGHGGRRSRSRSRSRGRNRRSRSRSRRRSRSRTRSPRRDRASPRYSRSRSRSSRSRSR